MRVERISRGELGECVPLIEAFFDAASPPGTFRPAVFLATWDQLFAAGIGVIFGLRNEERKLQGIFGAMKYPDPNTGEMVANEMFWWVQPEARGQGRSLLEAYEAWAGEQGARYLTMVHLSNSMPERLRKLYERRGYRESETHYIKEIG
jgi:GNAT superfamily N-acetyltransferase